MQSKVSFDATQSQNRVRVTSIQKGRIAEHLLSLQKNRSSDFETYVGSPIRRNWKAKISNYPTFDSTKINKIWNLSSWLMLYSVNFHFLKDFFVYLESPSLALLISTLIFEFFSRRLVCEFMSHSFQDSNSRASKTSITLWHSPQLSIVVR